MSISAQFLPQKIYNHTKCIINIVNCRTNWGTNHTKCIITLLVVGSTGALTP